MPAAHRQGDMSSQHACHFKPTPAIGGSQNVFINGHAAMRVSDQYLPHICIECDAGRAIGPHPSILMKGSSSVFINNLPAVRNGDSTNCGATADGGSKDVSFG